MTCSTMDQTGSFLDGPVMVLRLTLFRFDPSLIFVMQKKVGVFILFFKEPIMGWEMAHQKPV